MRKFLLAIFSVLLFACLGAAVACAGGGDTSGEYYTLVFRQTNGVAYDCEVKSGWEVREGTTVDFRLIIDEEATGTPVVYANSEVLGVNEDGSYSVTVTENTLVRVDGLMAQGSEYNRFVFESTPGVSFNSQTEGFENGMMVKVGTTISFSLVINEKYQGTPVVYANNTVLSADVNGVYTIDMIGPVTLRVEGLVKHVNVNFTVGETRVRYIGEDGNYIETDTPIDMTAGSEVKFKVQKSVYHQDGYTVLANKIVLNKADDGYYHFVISNETDDTDIKVDGLKEATSFVERANGGSGTEADPYKISEPIDLSQLALQINSGFYTEGRFYAAYYELTNDIDLEGEELFIIGDGLQNAAVFAGSFNGNGHTISNYRMSDVWTNQETFVKDYIAYVGLFGYVTPTVNSAPIIYDLHLDNFTITVDASKHPDLNGDTVYAGAIAGLAFGASIIGCSATNGTIYATGGNYGAYVGGLVGQQISAYSTTVDIAYESGIISSHSDVDVIIQGDDFVYAAGGITGILAVGEEHLSAYILNSYSTGDVAGSLNAGGIVGYAVAGTSVINCYSSGDISAYSPYEYNENYGTDEYYYANAGGLVGRAGFNTVIYNSFSSGEIYASSLGPANDKFRVMSATAAHIESGDELQDAHAYESSIVGCPDYRVTNITKQFITETMHWDEADWKFENGMPVINTDETEKDFTVSFVPATNTDTAKDFGTIADFEIKSEYRTMSTWSTLLKGIPEFMDGRDGGLRSYAYFFDAELTQRVFYSFIPTGDMTLYVGYADYSEVSGTYYLGESATVGARLEIDVDGTYVYRNGALIHASTYTWDGENLVLLYGYLGDLAELDAQYRDYYLSTLYVFGATKEDNKLIITGGYVQEVEYTEGVIGYDDEENEIYGQVLATTGNVFYMFSDEAPLVGVKSIEGFVYGRYYGTENGSAAEYKFNGNGTGVRTVGATETLFTYTVDDTDIIIAYVGGATVEGTIDADGYVNMIGTATIYPYDGFTGAWEREFAYNMGYTFDGKATDGTPGTWTYSGYDGTGNGTYTVSADGTLDAGTFTAKINDNGFLEITKGSITNIYYMGGSFTGEWNYSQRFGTGRNVTTVSVNLTLNGISNKGYGTATAEYGTGAIYDLNYHAVSDGDIYTIFIYSNEYLYARMSYDAGKNLLTGMLDGNPGRLSAYDLFKGIWVSNDQTLSTVQFNGNGFYDEATDEATGSLPIRATVFVEGVSSGSYSINRSTMVGTYVYKGVTYELRYNEQLNIIEVHVQGGSTFTLQHRDMWYGRQLEDEDGYVYTFEDGRGELASGGRMTAVNENNDYRNYTYYLNSDGSIRLDAFESTYSSGVITIDERDGKTVFLFTPSGSGSEKILTRHTAFTGEWAIGGIPGYLKIDKIYANNQATGSYQFGDEDQKDVTFYYDFEGDYLSFEYEYETEGQTYSETYHVYAIVSGTATELSIGPDDSISGGRNSICIPWEQRDEFRGVVYSFYDFKDKADTGETLVFDGLSASKFGSGTAVMYDSNGDLSGAFIYEVDSIYGYALIYYNYWAYYLIPVEKDEDMGTTVLFYAHDEYGTYYAAMRPDELFGEVIVDAENSSITYEFNGVGGVTRHNADGTDTIFSYIVLLADNLTYKHVLQFIDEAGVVYSATLDQSGESSSEWTIKLVEADEYFGVAAVDADSSTATFLFDGAGRVIRLSTEEPTVNYTYEKVSVDGKKTTFKFTNESGVEYTAVLDQSNADEEKWTVTLTGGFQG